MYSDVEKNVLEFGFIPGQSVADFGSGAGHYALSMSKVLGPKGRVYAIDLKQDVLVRLARERDSQGTDNIRVLCGDIEKPKGTQLANESVNAVVFSNILFQLNSKEGAISEAYRILKAGGKACVVEWSDISLLPKAKTEDHNKPTTESETKDLFLKFGFTFERAFQAGDLHWGLIFKK